MFRSASPSDFLPRIGVFSARSRVSLDTSCSSTAVGSCHTGPFYSVAVWPEEVSKVSEEPEVQGLRHQWLGHVLLRTVPFLLSDVLEVCHPHLHLHACLVHELDMLGYMPLWVTRLITRLSRRLIRETRQVQHKKSHCGTLSWRGKQARSWACNLVSLRIQFNSRTQISHLWKRKQNRYITCLKHINHG